MHSLWRACCFDSKEIMKIRGILDGEAFRKRSKNLVYKAMVIPTYQYIIDIH